MISLRVDMYRVMEARASLLFIGKGLPAAMQKAVEDTQAYARKTVSNKVSGVVAAPGNEIRARVKSPPPNSPNKQTVEAVVYLSGKPIPLNRFQATQNGTGVAVATHKGGTVRQINGAFIPKSGRLQGKVFSRVGKSRTPIRRETGLRLSTDPPSQNALNACEPEVQRKLEENIDAEVQNLVDAAFNRGANLTAYLGGGPRVNRFSEVNITLPGRRGAVLGTGDRFRAAAAARR